MLSSAHPAHDRFERPTSMQIRPATLKDIDLVVAMDHSYTTDKVWQLSVSEGTLERLAQLRVSPLPRSVKMPFPLAPEALRRVVHRCDYVWVAHESTGVLAYLGMMLMPGQNAGWVCSACVAPALRRTGLARQLMAMAINQARSMRLHSVMADLQTKNVPAARFCEAMGFKFSGYADNYYATQDIALFYSYRVR